MFTPSRMLPYFPVVGLMIGVLLALVDHVAGLFWPRFAVSVIDLVFLVWVTGALHLDGLGDTADGLYGNRPVEKALDIMKDSRVGAMGVVAIICGMTVKWAGLSAVDTGRTLVLVAVPALSRGAMAIAVRFLPYGRPEGLGRGFFEERVSWHAMSGLLVPAGLLLFLGLRGVLVLAVFVCLNLGMLHWYRRRVNCITGDMLGALNEVCEAALFLFAGAGGLF